MFLTISIRKCPESFLAYVQSEKTEPRKDASQVDGEGARGAKRPRCRYDFAFGKWLNTPDDATVARYRRRLGSRLAFFWMLIWEHISTDAVSFRSFSRMSARERDAAISAGSLGLQLSDWVERRFDLPSPNLIDLSYEPNPEICAHLLRQDWMIGERPIGNIIGLLETNGVRVLSLSESTASVNAFSFWRDEKPFVFLNNFKTAESSIYDAAHELAHLVMHKHGEPKEFGPQSEKLMSLRLHS